MYMYIKFLSEKSNYTLFLFNYPKTFPNLKKDKIDESINIQPYKHIIQESCRIQRRRKVAWGNKL